MSDKVMKDLKSFEPGKPAIQLVHPLYDNFGTAVSKAAARERLGIKNEELIILFFGFIRRYKGLDILLDAMGLLKAIPSAPGQNSKLLVAGEFYDDKKTYLQQIDELGIKNNVMLKTNFIPDDEVKYYFGAADVVIQPYRNATQSGVTPIAYHFEKPMIVTNVGALPDYVPHEKAGLVTEPTAASLAATIQRYAELGENYFLPQLREEKKKYSWEVFVRRVMELYDSILF
jgi:glycosyltransferase involved in cell wall biosynthesis